MIVFPFWPSGRSIAGAREAIAASLEAWQSDGPRRGWAIRRTGSRELAGYIALISHRDGGASIDLWLLPAARGQGLAQAAVRLIAAYAFEKLACQWLDAQVRPRNVAARRLFERCRFELWTRTRKLMLVYRLTAARRQSSWSLYPAVDRRGRSVGDRSVEFATFGASDDPG